MKRLTRIFPVFTLLAGAICALLRGQLYGALDEKGLIPAGHPAYLPLGFVTVLFALLLGLHYLWGKTRDYRIFCKLPVQTIGCLVGAAGLLYLYVSTPEEAGLFHILKLVAALCLLILAFFRLKAKKPSLAIFAALSLSLMLLCFGQYRQWGAYTQLQGYLFPALSALFTSLYSLYYLMMELPERPGKLAFFCNQAALFCCLVCLSTPLWPYYLCLALWLASGLFTQPYTMTLPKEVLQCIHKLEKAGHSAYVVGGCVRDALLGLTPHDYDLCTNATPEQLCQIFRNNQLVRSGEKHGTIGVVLHHKVYEITTYRTEGSYTDNRHPDGVTFVDRVEEDLARRDFTVNAMAYHPKTGYVDPFGGQQDLSDGILRAVGDPQTRFQEDALRILRGVRFACRFGLSPEAETEKAMQELVPLLDNLAAERVFSELTQILCHAKTEDILRYSHVLVQAVPELSPCLGFQQHSRYHIYDVYTHTGHVLGNTAADPALRWAALLHDVGKPQTFTQDDKGEGHFFGHAQISAQIADEVLHRLKASNALREQVVFLIAHHMDDLSADTALLRRKLSKYGSNNLKKLIQLQQADMGSKKRRPNGSFEKMLSIVDKLEQEEGQLKISDLAIDGHDLMALGYPAGPQLGSCQKALLQLVLDGELPNTKEALIQKAKALLDEVKE